VSDIIIGGRVRSFLLWSSSPGPKLQEGNISFKFLVVQLS